MLMLSKLVAGFVMLLHVYIFLLETVMYRTRAVKAFAIPPDMVERMRVPMSNQGCYNGFLALALALGLALPNPDVAHAFTVYGLVCVAIAGIWGAATSKFSILYIQTVPAAIGLITLALV